MSTTHRSTLRRLFIESLSGLELARLLAAAPRLARKTRGQGEPVLVLPGYLASNISTTPLRSYLSWLGHNVSGWDQGRNRGDVEAMLPQIRQQVRELRDRHGHPVHLIGWSLGGFIAREIARTAPDLVRQVISMGSPLMDNGERPLIRVPVTSLYSKHDGVVNWPASIDRHTPGADNIEVTTTHLGFGVSPEVYHLLADKLATR